MPGLVGLSAFCSLNLEMSEGRGGRKKKKIKGEIKGHRECTRRMNRGIER